MKWINKKSERFSRCKPGYKGRKNGLLFEVNDYTTGFDHKHIGWYVLISDSKTDKRFNSLWSNLNWEQLDDAQKWCETYTPDMLTEYWVLKELENNV